MKQPEPPVTLYDALRESITEKHGASDAKLERQKRQATEVLAKEIADDAQRQIAAITAEVSAQRERARSAFRAELAAAEAERDAAIQARDIYAHDCVLGQELMDTAIVKCNDMRTERDSLLARIAALEAQLETTKHNLARYVESFDSVNQQLRLREADNILLRAGMNPEQVAKQTATFVRVVFERDDLQKQIARLKTALDAIAGRTYPGTDYERALRYRGIARSALDWITDEQNRTALTPTEGEKEKP